MPTSPYFNALGERLPSVTTVISKRRDPGGLIHWAYQCGVAGIDYRTARDSAADAGTLCHAMIEEKIHGRDPEAVLVPGRLSHLGRSLVMIDTDPSILDRARTGFDAYLSWEEHSGIEIFGTELKLVSEQYQYGGTPDAIGRRSRRVVLPDWKTGRTYADHIIQLAAYRNLWDENHATELVFEAHLCRFDKEYGTFTHKQLSREMLDAGWEAFVRLRQVYEIDKQLAKMAK